MNLSKAVGPLMFEVDSIVPTNPMVSSVLFTLPISPLMDLMVSSFVVLGLNGFVVLAEFVCPAVPCDLVAGLSWRLSVLAGDKCSEKTESNNLSDVHFEFVINRKIQLELIPIIIDFNAIQNWFSHTINKLRNIFISLLSSLAKTTKMLKLESHTLSSFVSMEKSFFLQILIFDWIDCIQFIIYGLEAVMSIHRVVNKRNESIKGQWKDA